MCKVLAKQRINANSGLSDIIRKNACFICRAVGDAPAVAKISKRANSRSITVAKYPKTRVVFRKLTADSMKRYVPIVNTRKATRNYLPKCVSNRKISEHLLPVAFVSAMLNF